MEARFLAWLMLARVWIGEYPQSKQHSIIFQWGYKHAFWMKFPYDHWCYGSKRATVCFGLHKLVILLGQIIQPVGLPSFWIIVKEINRAKLIMKRHSLYIWDSWWQPGTPLAGVVCLHEHLHESKPILNFKSATKNGWLIGIVYYRVPPLFTSPDPCVAAPISSHCSGQSNPRRGCSVRDHRIVSKCKRTSTLRKVASL